MDDNISDNRLCAIDLPNIHDIGGPWVTVKTGSYKELVDFAQKTFGADTGAIQIISVVGEEEE